MPEAARESRNLSALAAGLCQDAGIRVELSQRTWAWDPLRRVILVCEDDLKAKGAIYCAAVLAHEVSHYFISRYHLFAPEFPSREALAHLLNAVEDPRVNTWIKRRYPGTGRWLRRLTEADGSSPLPPGLPDFILFCLECAREELRGWAPLPENALPGAIASALHRTRQARIEYAGTLPGGDLRPVPDDGNVTDDYRFKVWPLLLGRAQLDLPTLREQLVRVKVLAALQLAERHILPAAAELLERDLSRLVQWLKADARRTGRCESALAGGDADALRRLFAEAMRNDPGGGESVPGLRDLALRTFEAWLKSTRECTQGSGGKPLIAEARPGCPGAVGGTGLPGGRGRILRTPRGGRPGRRRSLRLPPPETLYDQAYQKIAGQLRQLVASIEDLLRPRKRLRESGGHRSGHRLDLRRVMAFEADPRTWDKLWRRKNIPDRFNTAVSLLVDLSGSMRGVKTDAAVAGTVLLAETLHRLQVSFAVNGFQDVLVPFCDFHEGLSSRVRDAVGEMPQEVEGCRNGGNNAPSYNDDGPCVREAAEQLLNHPADDRMLIVVSDGLPEGRRSTDADLRDAIRDISAEPRLKLVGIGLGPDTAHVKSFYPHSVADVPVERFAEEIAAVLRGIWG